MRTVITIELDDHVRRALSAHYGEKRLATRRTIRAWVNSMLEATLQDIISEYEQWCEEQEEARMLKEGGAN